MQSILELDINKYFSTTGFDPSPHRLWADDKSVSERSLPITYFCDNCGCSILFQTDDFQKHYYKVGFSNLQEEHKALFKKFTDSSKLLKDKSYLDFYCPKCKQPTLIIYRGGPSGYWGEFSFDINNLLVIKG